MYIFDDIFRPILAITFTAAAIIFIEDLSRIIRLIKTMRKTKGNLERWKKGQLSLEDIQGLTPREFQYWCGEFISRIGYTDIEKTPLEQYNRRDIKCKFHGKTAYVECKRFIYNEEAPNKVDEQICNKLLGEMLHDQISYGLVITSGKIMEECYDYIRNFKNSDKIQFIDGERIMALYSLLHSKQQHPSI